MFMLQHLRQRCSNPQLQKIIRLYNCDTESIHNLRHLISTLLMWHAVNESECLCYIHHIGSLISIYFEASFHEIHTFHDLRSFSFLQLHHCPASFLQTEFQHLLHHPLTHSLHLIHTKQIIHRLRCLEFLNTKHQLICTLHHMLFHYAGPATKSDQCSSQLTSKMSDNTTPKK